MRWSESVICKNGKVIFIVLALIAGIYALAVVRGDMPQLKEKIAKFPGLAQLSKARQQVYVQARLTEMAYLTPSFVPFLQYAVTQEQKSPGVLQQYASYYEQAAAKFPRNAGVFNILGYVYFNLGEEKKAIDAFYRSKQEHADYFWANYNLAVYYYLKNDYEKSNALLAAALPYHREVTLNILYTSVFYQQLLQTMQTPPDQWLRASFADSVRKGFIMMIVGAYYRQEFQPMLDYARYALEAKMETPVLFQYYAGRALQRLGQEKEAKTYLAGVPEDIRDLNMLYVPNPQEFMIKLF